MKSMIQNLLNQSLKNPPLEMSINNWRINYLSFSGPSTAGKTPVVILGGAFQKFDSFRNEVLHLSKDFPVFIVDLPGQGSNTQSSEDLGFKEYAELLKLWADRLGMSKISPIALSYGSAIGYHFASLYPERVDKLILGGITHGLRRSVRSLLEASLEALDKKDKEKFAAGVVLNLMNPTRQEIINGAKVIARAMHRNMLKISEEDTYRYRQNTKRLIDLEGLPTKAPDCETLVFTGEFDHFTTPYECFQVAKTIPKSTFAVVNESDHLAPYEKKDVIGRLYKRFLGGQPLNRMKDIEVMGLPEFPRERIRMDPRWLFNDVAYLSSENGAFIPVNIITISHFGCKIYTSFTDHKLMQGEGEFFLHLPEQDLKLEMSLFSLNGGEGHYLGHFRHCSLSKSKDLQAFIGELSLSCVPCWSAA